ncbi:MAG: imidazolonepropionase [Xanthomonadales bacterium]|nr:imidazolonepropionase [Xanthomonadales bacterium]
MTENATVERLVRHANVATLADNGSYGLIEDGWVAWSGDRIIALGNSTETPPTALEVIDARGRLLTPGLIDCHTHLVFAGDRAAEFEMRLEGASYEAIARAGGGILSSVRATRAADFDALYRASEARFMQLVADGVTTIEIKSGYGLDVATELRMLEVARALGRSHGIRVRTTLLGAHALPPEYADDRSAYLDLVCGPMLAQAVERGLVDAVDAFCERIGFSLDETRRVFESARAAGVPVKLHAEQLSASAGSSLVAEFGGLSADHVEFCSDQDVQAMATAGTVAVLLPAAFYALRETRLPPIEAFRAAGVPMAVASDLNPGTSPILSLRLAMNMACTLFRLTPLECLLGSTVHAARALGLDRVGRIAPGWAADLALWPFSTPAELSYWIGGMQPDCVIAAGRTVVSR